MNPQGSSHPQNTVQDILGRALGLVAGLMLTMPAYHLSYPYFFEFVLYYSPASQRELWEIVWIVSLFFLIFSLVLAAVVMVVVTLKKTVLFLVMSYKIRRERSKWQ